MNPFDLKQALLAKHSQHVVLIHFPIALFIAEVGLDVLAHWRSPLNLAAAAYYNFLVATLSTLPVIATGLLAWQYQVEGRRLKGIFVAAPRARMCIRPDDLVGLVCTLPWPSLPAGILAAVSLIYRTASGRSCDACQSPSWVPQRSKRTKMTLGYFGSNSEPCAFADVNFL